MNIVKKFDQDRWNTVVESFENYLSICSKTKNDNIYDNSYRNLLRYMDQYPNQKKVFVSMAAEYGIELK